MIAFEVETDNILPFQEDGPQQIANASGLPKTGSTWLGLYQGRDNDPWAFCLPFRKVTMWKRKGSDPHHFWRVEFRFSTRPRSRCDDTPIEDPLMEPQKMSGSFLKSTEVGTVDRNGKAIESSSHETPEGPNNEWPKNKPTVHIEQNVPFLDLHIPTSMIDTVNANAMWGLEPRMVALADFSWERNVFQRCGYYYTRIFDFDIDFKTHDRNVIDEGDKVLRGHWATVDDAPATGWVLDGSPDKTNPQDFIRAIGKNGNPIHAKLDGNGEPLDTSGVPVTYKVEKFKESNFALLGIEMQLPT